MGEGRKNNKTAQTLTGKALVMHILQGALRYVLLSIFVSLFFEDTLFWMFLATAGVTAWTMHRVAMHGRAQLPGKLIKKWKKYEKESRNFDLQNPQERKEWEQIEAYKVQKYHEPPFTLTAKVWFAFLAPLIGSFALQMLYFWGIGEPINIGLLFSWVFSNLALTALFSAIGAAGMFLFLLHKQKKENTHLKQKPKQSNTDVLNRLLSSVVLILYITTLIAPLTTPVQAAPDCSKEELTTEELIGCYDPEAEYKTRGEPVDQEPVRRIPLDPGPGNAAGNLQKYYNQYPSIPPEQINELYQKCQATNKALVVLKKRPDGDGYYILTSYPVDKF